jgi:hypothetical protein
MDSRRAFDQQRDVLLLLMFPSVVVLFLENCQSGVTSRLHSMISDDEHDVHNEIFPVMSSGPLLHSQWSLCTPKFYSQIDWRRRRRDSCRNETLFYSFLCHRKGRRAEKPQWQKEETIMTREDWNVHFYSLSCLLLLGLSCSFFLRISCVFFFFEHEKWW